jgi:hypothetical protein
VSKDDGAAVSISKWPDPPPEPGGWRASLANVGGGCDQSADPLKSTLAQENMDVWSLRVTSPSGRACRIW